MISKHMRFSLTDASRTGLKLMSQLAAYTYNIKKRTLKFSDIIDFKINIGCAKIAHGCIAKDEAKHISLVGTNAM